MPLKTEGRTFFYVRHGLTEANQQKLWCGGDWDIALHETGREQAQNLADKIHQLSSKIDKIYSSPMRRALETTSHLNLKSQKSVEIVEELREWRIGQLEKQPWTIALLGTSINDWSDPPGGESVQQFKNRIEQGVTFCLQQTAVPLIVSHGAVGRMLIEILGAEQKHFQNCCLYQFTSIADGNSIQWRLEEH